MTFDNAVLIKYMYCMSMFVILIIPLHVLTPLVFSIELE